MTDRPPEKRRKLPPRPCPICAKMSIDRFRPFCSTRCANIDLHRWLGGRYAIPTEETPDPLSPGAGDRYGLDDDPDRSS